MEPEFVTATRSRKGFHFSRERFVFLPFSREQPKDMASNDYTKWMIENEWAIGLSVHPKQHPQAQALAVRLADAYEKGDARSARNTKSKLLRMRILKFEERTLQGKWDYLLDQMPSDIGGPNKPKIREAISSCCGSRVLEAMCGFNSYVQPKRGRTVVAMDYSHKALELYAHPKRKRILFDLNTVRRRGDISFFEDGQFDTVVITFGYNYLDHPVLAFKEFRRLLCADGSLIIVENPHQGYWDMARRCFRKKICEKFLRQASFSNISIGVLPIAEEWEIPNGGCYYLVQAKKT